MQHDAIRFENVSKVYRTMRGSYTALNGLSFAVSKGTITALLGPNGAGKSSAMRIIASLSSPTSGTVTVGDTTNQTSATTSVGYVGQNLTIDNFATVWENIHFQTRLQGVPKGERTSRVNAILSTYSLEDIADKKIMTLSGGQKRRVDIAMAMVHSPSILLLDEPTINLDPSSRAQVWEALCHAQQQHGVTILFATHYLEEAEQHAQKVVFINKGNVIIEGSPEELMQKVRGETLVLTFTSESEAIKACSIMQQEPNVIEVFTVGNSVMSIFKDASSVISGAITRLSVANINVERVVIDKPKLDDLYMILTGDSFDKVNLAGEEEQKKLERPQWQS